jgi:hypothetical protein
MKDLYYFAAWTDSDCLCGCDHQHDTLISAVACNAPCAGGYVIAVEKGKYRALNEAEEIQFQRLKYGVSSETAQPLSPRELVRLNLIRIGLEPK